MNLFVPKNQYHPVITRAISRVLFVELRRLYYPKMDYANVTAIEHGEKNFFYSSSLAFFTEPGIVGTVVAHTTIT